MGIAEPSPELATKIEVLQDLEGRVTELMEGHERKRDLWFPCELLAAGPGTDPDAFRLQLRRQAEGIPDAVRAALALNMLTEEGLPHFHRLLAVYLGDDSHWRRWNNLWTAEEDR
ncbi:MAG TPA: acyl-ACP desaturase, partial [Gemmatimonadales bacterium]|nr:acyl-ACP desaturase [Gemmatimonadales bacterium]